VALARRRLAASDGAPGGETFCSDLAISSGGPAVVTRAEVAGERAVGGGEPLGMAWSLEAPSPLALPHRLKGMLGPVVQPLVPTVLDAGEHRASSPCGWRAYR